MRGILAWPTCRKWGWCRICIDGRWPGEKQKSGASRFFVFCGTLLCVSMVLLSADQHAHDTQDEISRVQVSLIAR